MTSPERAWSLKYGLILASLCSLPIFLGFMQEGSDWSFSGFVIGVEDGNSYIAKMLLGSYGDWRFRTPYTTMEQWGEIIFLPYLLLGKLAQPPALHLQLVAIYQLFRFIVTPFATFSTYRFSTLFLTEHRWRQWFTVLATFGGGLGWVVPLLGRSELLGSIPLDFISPESFGFLAIFGLPHLILARALLLAALHAYLQDGMTRSGSFRAGVYLLLLTLVQSLSTLSALAVIGFHQLLLMVVDVRTKEKNWRGTWLPAALRAALPSTPLLGYFIARFSTDPFLLAWTDQNQILSPHPLHYLLAYGAVLLPVIAGIARKPWRDQPAWLLPVGWVFALPVLAYFPHNLQRRLVEGVWVALLLLAAYALQSMVHEKPRLAAVRLFLGSLTIISPLMLISGGIQVAYRPAVPAFVPAAHARAYQWLMENAPQGSVVLADFGMSNAIPAWAPLKVLQGHGPESVGLKQLEPQIRSFYSGEMGAGERQAWLQKLEIEYVIIGQGASAAAAGHLEFGANLTPVYEDIGVIIYAVGR